MVSIKSKQQNNTNLIGLIIIAWRNVTHISIYDCYNSLLSETCKGHATKRANENNTRACGKLSQTSIWGTVYKVGLSARPNCRRFSIICLIPLVWNEIPLVIREAKNSPVFLLFTRCWSIRNQTRFALCTLQNNVIYSAKNYLTSFCSCMNFDSCLVSLDCNKRWFDLNVLLKSQL